MQPLPNALTEIERFGSWDEYQAAEYKIHQLVQQGRLGACGLDPHEPSMYVQVYKTPDGEVWRLAVPDHAFRGYLKRENPTATKRLSQ